MVPPPLPLLLPSLRPVLLPLRFSPGLLRALPLPFRRGLRILVRIRCRAVPGLPLPLPGLPPSALFPCLRPALPVLLPALPSVLCPALLSPSAPCVLLLSLLLFLRMSSLCRSFRFRVPGFPCRPPVFPFLFLIRRRPSVFLLLVSRFLPFFFSFFALFPSCRFRHPGCRDHSGPAPVRQGSPSSGPGPGPGPGPDFFLGGFVFWVFKISNQISRRPARRIKKRTGLYQPALFHSGLSFLDSVINVSVLYHRV
jgi:hypothetical protein